MAQDGLQHQLLDIICDGCGEPMLHTDICFDLQGCFHLPCFGCMTQGLQDYTRAGASIGGGGLVRCPVPNCLTGFLDQQTGVEEVDAAEAALVAEEEERGEELQQHILSETTFYCPICMETKSLTEGFFGARGCNHTFCLECVAGYVEARVEENFVPIGCPDPECHDGKLEPEACRGVVREEVFDRWGALLCESAVEAPMRFYCPYSDCSALLANEGDEEGRPMMESLCLHCGRTCCAQCRAAPWHEGKSCEEYRYEQEETEELAGLMELAKIGQWQKCLNCGALVERVEGCVFIRCRCQHCFCYRCALPMNAEDQKHFCANCGLTWDS